jgi:hypothetical protein
MNSDEFHARRLSLSVMVKTLFAYKAGTTITPKEAPQLTTTASSDGQFEQNYISFPPLEDVTDDMEPHTGASGRLRNPNGAIQC